MSYEYHFTEKLYLAHSREGPKAPIERPKMSTARGIKSFRSPERGGLISETERDRKRFAATQRPQPTVSWKHLLRPPSFCRPDPGARPVPSTEGFSKGPELQRRPGSLWHGGVCYAKRVEDLEVSASTEAWSRLSWSTKDAEAMRPSILWNALRGWGAPILNEAASCWLASVHSGVTTALIRAESITVLRNDRRRDFL